MAASTTTIVKGRTWRGVLEHLIGAQDFNGQNGLATFVNAKPEIDGLIAEVAFRERSYGKRNTGVSVSASAKLPLATLPFGAKIDFTLGTSLTGAEASCGLKGSWDLKGVFKLGKALTQNTPATAAFSGVFDTILGKLPDIGGSGELTSYVGVSKRQVPYYRIQTGLGVKFILPKMLQMPIPNSDKIFHKMSMSMGRTWQLQLTHLKWFIPTQWDYE